MNEQDDYLGPEWLIAIGVIALLCLMLAGCQTVGQATEPSTYTYQHKTEEKKPDGTIITKTETVTHKGPENEKKSGHYSFQRQNADGGMMNFKHGASSAIPFDWEIAAGVVDAWPATIIGGILIVAGAVGIYLGERLIGGVVMAAGGCCVALPFVAETLRLILLIAGLVLIAAGVAYGAWKVLWQGKKLNLVKKATNKDAQERLKAKGDKAGAAAAAYVDKIIETGKEDDAKAVANNVNK